MKSIAIVGGGPAGAAAAERLLRGSDSSDSGACPFEVTIFEERLGWEKPCGGGLPAKAVQRYPFLLEACELFTRVQEAELVAADGETARFRLRSPLLIYSRAALNRLLLHRAEAAGAQVETGHIRAISREGAGWRLESRKQTYRADFLILASGARSRLRDCVAGPLAAQDLMLTYGWFAPGSDSLLRVQFFEDFEGYAWAFPRPDHFSLGILGRTGEASMENLQQRLRLFVARFGYHPEGGQVFSHIVPALGPKTWSTMRLAGEGWALAGDAAGLADPLTSEGIYFAMRSGELIAEALLEGRPEEYLARVWREFGRRHAAAARLAPRFYRGKFMRRPSTTRMVQFCSQSAVFMNLLQDLFEGSQSYTGLVSRVYKSIVPGLFQYATSTLKKPLPNHDRL
ncbi:MAG: NAD(P)/FAD-dependent oxidoreductase [Terriglobia bacterium]